MAFFLSLSFFLALQAPQPEALYNAGVAALQAQRYQEAEASFRRDYALEPDNIRGLAGIVQVLLAQKKNAEALDLLRSESAKHPQRADLHIAAGKVAWGMGQRAAALGEFQQALSLLDVVSKETAEVYRLMGEVYRDNGDAKASLEALRKAVQLTPADPSALIDMATALDAGGDKSGAIAQYRAVLAVNPRSPVAANNLAYLLADTGGDLYEALRLARSAKQNAPGIVDISDTIGWVSLKLGWVDEAFDTLSDVVRQQPGNKSFRSHLAQALTAKRNASPALNELKALLQAEPTEENQRILRDLLSSQRPK